jgi:hypothetical protein
MLMKRVKRALSNGFNAKIGFVVANGGTVEQAAGRSEMPNHSDQRSQLPSGLLRRSHDLVT